MHATVTDTGAGGLLVFCSSDHTGFKLFILWPHNNQMFSYVGCEHSASTLTGPLRRQCFKREGMVQVCRKGGM